MSLLAAIVLAYAVPAAETRAPDTHRAAPANADPGSPSIVDQDALLQLGELLQKDYRPRDAEAVYRQILAGNSGAAVKAEALRRLKSLIEFPSISSAGAQIALGNAYEQAGRLQDSEAAYAKALDEGLPIQRRKAIERLESVIERRETFYRKHLRPVWDASINVAIPIVLLALLVLLVGVPLQIVGRRFHRNTLRISDSWQAPGAATVGAGFGDTLIAMHERMAFYLRARSPLGSAGKMPMILQAQSPDFIDLVSAVNSSAGPIVRWCVKLWRQPSYLISGSTEATPNNVRVRVKLEHAGNTIALWTQIHALNRWFTSEQDLAYEILLTLKEYADANAA